MIKIISRNGRMRSIVISILNMSLTKKILWALAVLLIGLQFFQPIRNDSGVVNPTHIERLYAIPPDIKAILVRSCYDCHSDRTRYPWYSRIQPGAWYMSGHIEKGKEELNLSRFGEYSARRQRNKLRAMSGQIKSGEMPLASYTLIHGEADLSQHEKQVLMDWLEALQDSIKN
ncbi:MAG: heme-binding domain-containing protein [Flavobacterium sp.]